MLFYMKFIAKYLHLSGQKEPYYRTIYSDSVNEAIKEADRYCRKGYLCAGVKSNAMESA